MSVCGAEVYGNRPGPSKTFVYAVGEDLVFDLAPDLRAGDHCVEFDAQFRGQFAALGEQFLGDFGHEGAFDLAIYEYVVHTLNR